MTWFGEYPDGIPESSASFLQAVTDMSSNPRSLTPFKLWSDHYRSWEGEEWKNIPRKWQKNLGWNVINPGTAQSQLIICNLNTLTSAAGTGYFPELNGKILLIEEMAASWSLEERNLRQLSLMGVFDKITGLLIGKPESPNSQGAPFSLEELILEIVGPRNYPIVGSVDCSHTVPMHSIGEALKVELIANKSYDVSLKMLEPFITPSP
tara:strand:+ start:53 stop:676 length:624 start_codon:yes stop_codon:yes gene_type:complete